MKQETSTKQVNPSTTVNSVIPMVDKNKIQGNWTDEQWRAIISKDRDILVAAAAGSGKTAVLVERIIRRITDADDPIDVDQLLVVTFTNAAAAEMRHRIGDRLEAALRENPESSKLERQLALINKASISTLHSFCLDVVRKFYYLLDIDPNFRIADDTEAVLMREEVLEELLEDCYADATNVCFFRLADCYADDRSDVALQSLVLKLYDYSRSHPSPTGWLEEVANNYQLEGITSLDELPWVRDFLAEIQLQLQGIRSVLENARDVSNDPEGPALYIDTIDQDIQQIDAIYESSQESWGSTYQAFQKMDFPKMKPVKKGTCDPRLKELAMELRNQGKENVKRLKEATFTKAPQDYLQDIKDMAPIIRELVNLVKNFAKQYTQAKTKKGLVDFADLEHYCLAILTDDSNTTAGMASIASEAAKQLQKRYVEILIDEYQDTNLVQESILNLLISDSNYRFMVGDVKQSVYRFRLAEPELFLDKYKTFLTHKDIKTNNRNSLRIDLSKNFRSRQEVIHSTNFIFKQIMDETVGEIPYDQKAQLEHGATYYPEKDCRAELILIDQLNAEEDGTNDKSENELPEYHYGQDGEQNWDYDEDADEANEIYNQKGSEEDLADLQVVQLEARVIAKQIKELIGKGQTPIYQVYDKNLDQHQQSMRKIQFRDIVILLRATASWAPVIIEELKKHGIPAYAELSTGYFTATEVTIMMSLLKVIDNPYQDIPLAAVLRSPVVGLTGEELAQIRIHDLKAPYYDAMKKYVNEKDSLVNSEDNNTTWQKLNIFYIQLQNWRTKARQGSLSDLIWQIYRETGYYDFVGGMVEGNQRQANLRALYDRARAYEKTSFRGLFRFLNFIERMQERGGDLGTARALGEQEDVVRIMTIHKSKGLEFPVVFVAGLGKQFNFQDIRGKYLVHKKLGFGTVYVDTEKRISYPLLPQLAIRQRVKMEQLAEEMRILYVALTRAKEKLFLLGTVKGLDKEINKWGQHIGLQDWILPDYERARSKKFLDWIGPAIIRHREAGTLHQKLTGYCNGYHERIVEQIRDHKASWKITCFTIQELTIAAEELQSQDMGYEQLLKSYNPVPVKSSYYEQVNKRLHWEYKNLDATTHLAKQSVSGIKKNQPSVNREQTIRQQPIVDRPRFLQEQRLTAAERGTVIHLIMQHLDLSKQVTEASIEKLIQWLLDKEFITEEQCKEIDLQVLVTFFKTKMGRRLNNATRVNREIPFSLAVPVGQVYPNWSGGTEQVLIQGVVDCVFEDVNGLVLLDYKSDKITNLSDSDLLARYQLQIDLYSQAIEGIWKRTLNEKYLYFFDGSKLLSMK